MMHLLVAAVNLLSHGKATDKSKIQRCRPDAVSNVASLGDARPSSEDGRWLAELALRCLAPPSKFQLPLTGTPFALAMQPSTAPS